MVLSGRSCGLEEPFTEDVINKSDYLYQKKPKLKERVKDVQDVIAERLAKEKAKLVQQNKEYGMSSGNNMDPDQVVEFRVKKGDSYHMVKEKVKGGKSKEDLLDMRVKKKTDKFCWF